MARFPHALIYAMLSLYCHAQDDSAAKSTDHFGLTEILSFEAQHASDSPAGWGGGPAGTIFVDGKGADCSNI